MIDIHSHILPGMDDGSDSPEMSAQLLRQLSAQGVDTVAATPHFYARKDTPQKFLRRRAAAFERLHYDPDCHIRIIPGAEVAYFDGMSRSEDLSALQLGTTGLILVEMPFGTWTQRMLRELGQIQLQTGLVPVLAHVDRYRKQMKKHRRQLMDMDVYFQCNAEAFLPKWGRFWALRQLRRGEIHFLGSDCHNLADRAPQMDAAARIIEKNLGKEPLEKMNDLAKRILHI